MKNMNMKAFGLYSIVWVAALGLFNVISFVTPGKINGVSKFDASFWVAYSLITAMFVLQLGCTFFAFRAQTAQKAFYRLSLVKIGVASFVIMFVVGTLAMGVAELPNWIGIILCCIVLFFYIFAIVKAFMVIAPVEAIDKKIKVKTMFIKLLTADAEVLLTKAEGEEMTALVKKVYEAVRYSDPMSDEVLASVESRILEVFATLSGAVEAKDMAAAEESAKQILTLLTERNAKCRVLK